MTTEQKVKALQAVLIALLLDDGIPQSEIRALQSAILVVLGQQVQVRNLTQTLDALGQLVQDHGELGFSTAIQAAISAMIAREGEVLTASTA